MELVFLALLIVLMAGALGSGFPVAFALPGSAIVTILIAAGVGLVFAGDTDAYFHQGGPAEWLSAGVTNFRGVYWEVERDTLIAIPLFVFMGIMLQRSKIAEDLLVTMAKLFGPIPGGLGISVVFVGALLAATTGILGATVVAMGLISLPAMQRNAYSTPLASGTIAASGTLGQIIPPSIVLIILADQLASAVDQAGTARTNLYKAATGEFSLPSEFAVTSTSAGDMFMGAIGPGLVLVGLYMLYILVIALIRPRYAPAVPFEGKFDAKLLGQVLIILVPPLTLIFVVLGSIIGGVATVNQAGAIGAIGATIMAGYRLRTGHADAFIPAIVALIGLGIIAYAVGNYDINVKNVQTAEDEFALTLAVIGTAIFVVSVVWSLIRTFTIDDTLNGVMLETAKTTSLVFIILLGAAMLTAAFRAFGGEELVREFLTSLPGGFWTQFLIVMTVIFLLGFFLDFIEIAVVVVPIVAPILLMDPGANVTAVWLGVMIGLNIQTSFLTPPFGFALFYLRGVAPASVKTTDIYKGVIPFIALQLGALGIVGNYPPLVNYLPSRISLLGETAPPPVNPLLQHCVGAYLGRELDENRSDIMAAIEQAQSLPLDVLPRSERGDLEDAFESAATSFDRLADWREARAAVEAATPDYRPLHTLVRRLERDIRNDERDVEGVRRALDDLRFAEGPTEARRADLEAELARLEAEIASLTAEIPDDWEARHDTFAELTRAEQSAERDFRRAMEEGYDPVGEIATRLAATDTLLAAEDDLKALLPALDATEPEAMQAEIERVEDLLRDAEPGRDVTRGLSRARRALRNDRFDPEEARDQLESAVEGFDEEKAWRVAGAEEVLPGLRAYREALRGNIGLRSQPQLTRAQALDVAACQSTHRDISLYF
ncbi:MAG: TRAP transporter large permease subunit [Paracoccaceae bacterium]